jgi:catechol 2,3-dioxygenase-like lactoylglutathione lyase family enzyme
MKLGQIHHIEYYVLDLKTTREFWGWLLEKLGYTLSQTFGDGFSYEHSSGTYIVFVQVKDEYKNIQNNRQTNGLNHIAFSGATLKELDELQTQLESKSIKILKRKNDYLCFEDANDFAVEVYAKI